MSEYELEIGPEDCEILHNAVQAVYRDGALIGHLVTTFCEHEVVPTVFTTVFIPRGVLRD